MITGRRRDSNLPKVAATQLGHEPNPRFLIKRLGVFVAGLALDDIPPSARDRAALNLLDTIASAAGGFATLNATQVRAAAKSFFGGGPVAPWFNAEPVHRAAAILSNCAAASALDIDDGHRGASGHPGAAIVPAVLAEAVSARLGMRDVLGGLVVGYEIACRVAAARVSTRIDTYSAGRWVGFGVAAAIGWMRDLDAETIANAMAIAGAEAPINLPAGTYGRLSSVKGGSPWATLAGAMAVERAVAGADGPEEILDRAEIYDVDMLMRDLGRRWEIEATYLKPYSACRYAHAAIDAVLELVGGRALGESDISEMEVQVFPECFTITNEVAPRTLEGAQFSIPFCVALAALRGAKAFRPMRENTLADPEVRALARRVSLVATPDFADAFPSTTPSRVLITISGASSEKTVHYPLGEVANPLSWDDVVEKFHELVRGAHSVRVDDIVESCRDLRRGHDASQRLIAALST
jgi:2-methylcitrate dehydratase PrpD